MKKFLLTFTLFLLMPLGAAVANVDNDQWSYFFHLQYQQGVLAVDVDAKQAYDSIPELYAEHTDPSATDFSGAVVSVQGKTLAQFGFDKPTSMVVALGKSVFMVKAPYFADADHVIFYKKGGVKLFTVSVKGSSFCNDNNKCDSAVGENYLNCPIDCPLPANATIPNASSAISPPETAPSTTTNAEIVPVDTITPPMNIGESSGTVTITRNTTSKPVSTSTIVIFVVGILALLLAGILWWIRRLAD